MALLTKLDSDPPVVRAMKDCANLTKTGLEFQRVAFLRRLTAEGTKVGGRIDEVDAGTGRYAGWSRHRRDALLVTLRADLVEVSARISQVERYPSQ